MRLFTILTITVLALILTFVNCTVCIAQNVTEYWEKTTENSYELKKYKTNKSRIKNKSLAEFLAIKKNSDRFHDTIINRNIDIANQFSTSIFGKDSIIKSVIFYDDEYAPNAAIDANGHIILGVTLCNLLDENELTAMMAHEAAHLALKHHEAGYLKCKENERDARIMSGIVQGLYAAAVMYNGYTLAKSGIEVPINSYLVAGTMIAISESFIRNTLFMNTIYSKEQEIEADFAAAKFMDHINLGRKHLVSALTKVRNYYTELGFNTKTMNTNSTHPSMDDRIKYLLKYTDIPAWARSYNF